MLMECLFTVCVLMITLSFLVGFMMLSALSINDTMIYLHEEAKYNQIQSVFENDLFVRRHSEINKASNGQDKFNIGFWEMTDGELKYLIYDFHLQNKSLKIRRITRSCFNQEDLTGKESKVYCQRMIENISNGIYSTPNQPKYQQDYSQFCDGNASFNGDIINVKLGDYHYVFN